MVGIKQVLSGQLHLKRAEDDGTFYNQTCKNNFYFSPETLNKRKK